MPRTSLPKVTLPLFSAIMALSFALRASKSSATLGRPPVISFVLDVYLGKRAITSPANIFCPSMTERIESGTR